MREIRWFYPAIGNGESHDHNIFNELNSIVIPEILYDEEKVKDFEYYIDILGRGVKPEWDNQDNAGAIPDHEQGYHDDNGDNRESSEKDTPYGLGSETLLELALSLRLQPVLHNGFHDQSQDNDSDYHEVSYQLSPDDNRQARQIADDHDLAWRYIIYQTELMKAADALQKQQDDNGETDYEIREEADSIRKFISDYDQEWNRISWIKQNNSYSDDEFPRYNDPRNIRTSEEGNLSFDYSLSWENYQYLTDNPKYTGTMHELRRLMVNYRSNSLRMQPMPYGVIEELINNISVKYATRLILYRCIAHAFGYARNMRVFYMALDYDGSHQGRVGYDYYISEDFRYYNIVDSLIEITSYHVSSYLGGPDIQDRNMYMLVGSADGNVNASLLDYEKSMNAMRRLVDSIDQNAGNLMRYRTPSSTSDKMPSGCFGILEYATSGTTVNYFRYFSFSGIFDTDDDAIKNDPSLFDKYQRTSQKQMDEFVRKVIMPSPELGHFTQAICNLNMITYRRGVSGPVQYALGNVLGKWSASDIKRNFSCCERKMLPLMRNDALPDGCGYIFTKFNACDICQESIDDAKNHNYRLDTHYLYQLKSSAKMQTD